MCYAYLQKLQLPEISARIQLEQICRNLKTRPYRPQTIKHLFVWQYSPHESPSRPLLLPLPYKTSSNSHVVSSALSNLALGFPLSTFHYFEQTSIGRSSQFLTINFQEHVYYSIRTKLIRSLTCTLKSPFKIIIKFQPIYRNASGCFYRYCF